MRNLPGGTGTADISGGSRPRGARRSRAERPAAPPRAGRGRLTADRLSSIYSPSASVPPSRAGVGRLDHLPPARPVSPAGVSACRERQPCGSGPSWGSSGWARRWRRGSTSAPRRNPGPNTWRLHTGDRIIIVGNTLAERMQYFGHFETLLHSRFPDNELVVRNLGCSADELTLRDARAGVGFVTTTATAPATTSPTCSSPASGSTSRSPARPASDQFKDGPGQVRHARRPPRRLQRQGAAELVLRLADRPRGPRPPRTRRTARRTTRTSRSTPRPWAEVADGHGVTFVDLFGPSQRAHGGDRPKKLTINGIHLNDDGDRQVAGGPRRGAVRAPAGAAGRVDCERLRAEVNEKNLQFWYDYRAINGNYIYGGRKDARSGS